MDGETHSIHGAVDNALAVFMKRGDGSEACRPGKLELIAIRQAGAACAGERELREHSPSVGNHCGGCVCIERRSGEGFEIVREMNGCWGRGVGGGCSRDRVYDEGLELEDFASPGGASLLSRDGGKCRAPWRIFKFQEHFYHSSASTTNHEPPQQFTGRALQCTNI